MSNSNNLLQVLNWRYAVKKFDSSKKVSDDDLKVILEAMRLSPSAYGLQPWKFLVISNPEIKAKLQPAAYNQPQITDSSHLLVLCAKTDLGQKDVDAYMHDMANTRNIPVDALQGFADMISGFMSNFDREGLTNWAKKQTYIALGFALNAAAQIGVDSCPMEGFDPQAFDEILGLKEKNLTTSVICTLGYRSSEDETANATKVRFSKDELFEFID